MDNILDEASALVQCKECPWYKSCVLPMRLSREDIKKQMQLTMPNTSLGNEELIGALVSAAQELLLESCPVFIKRLRENPRLAEQIKKVMQSWGREPER